MIWRKILNKFILVAVAAAISVGGFYYYNSVNGIENTKTIAVADMKPNKLPDDKSVDAANAAVQENKIKEEVKSEIKYEQAKAKEDYILIRKKDFAVYAINSNGDIVASYGCALGKNPGQKYREGDMKTPDGTFVIDEIIDASSWTHDFKDGKGEIAGAYGPWFLSLDTYNLSQGAWGGIGIHGTHDPASIGTLASEGCIRLRNQDIEALKKFAHVGMKVVIEE